MVVMMFSDLRKMTVVSQDAYNVGDIVDIRYNAPSWNIEGIKVRCNKDVAGHLSSGSSKSYVLMKPPKFVLNDFLLLPDVLMDSRSYVGVDNDLIPSVSNLIGKRVSTQDQQPLGTVDGVNVDLDNWILHSFTVKLDKVAHESLGIKKGLGFLSKTVSGITMSHVAAITEVVALSIDMSEVKDVVILN